MKHVLVLHAGYTLGGRTYYLGRHGSKASKDEYKRLVGEFIANRHSAKPFLKSVP